MTFSVRKILLKLPCWFLKIENDEWTEDSNYEEWIHKPMITNKLYMIFKSNFKGVFSIWESAAVNGAIDPA